MTNTTTKLQERLELINGQRVTFGVKQYVPISTVPERADVSLELLPLFYGDIKNIKRYIREESVNVVGIATIVDSVVVAVEEYT